ncbi:hypothetical protein E6C27_scaffold25G00910 [Cucumis melo var. makuwa]|uniref:Uncharacterized protein n=1 Tax=Cucumis melo var. makuwa TaxID=1194695 RepID=A0A5A7VES5_CUCMM|nr:hypothetical protein E6C27_scaffold25G00910 [Cucumis melo var. makuwa]
MTVYLLDHSILLWCVGTRALMNNPLGGYELLRSFNVRGCSYSWRLGRKLVSPKELRSSKVFLKLETWKKACILKGASIFEGVLEVGDLEESLYLQRSFNLRSWRLGRKLVSSKELRSSKVFLKLETWKKVCIFKGASIFEGVLELGSSEELQSLSVFLKFESSKKPCIFEGGRLQELRRLLFFGRILSRPSGVNNFQPLQMKRTLLFIEFPGGLLWTWVGLIHRPGRSDQAPSSFGGVLLPSAIQLLWGTIGLLSLDPPPCFCRRIHRPGRSDQASSSFGEVVLPSVIQLLSRDDRAFAVRSTALVGAIRHLRPLEGDIAVSDPTSIGGRSSFCRQIHRPSRSDRAPSSFEEVILPSAIQLLSGDDRAFAVRSTALVGAIGHLRRLERWYCRQRSNFYRGRSGFCCQIQRPGRSDRTPSSFGEVVLPSAIQLLSRDDQDFAVRSTAVVGAIGHLRPLEM